MTTALIIFLSGTLGTIAGYALGIKNRANCALRFGKWNINCFKGALYPNSFYFNAYHDKAEVFAVLNKNGDIDLIFKDENAK